MHDRPGGTCFSTVPRLRPEPRPCLGLGSGAQAMSRARLQMAGGGCLLSRSSGAQSMKLIRCQSCIRHITRTGVHSDAVIPVFCYLYGHLIHCAPITCTSLLAWAPMGTSLLCMATSLRMHLLPVCRLYARPERRLYTHLESLSKSRFDSGWNLIRRRFVCGSLSAPTPPATCKRTDALIK